MSGGAYYNEHDPYAAAWLRNLIAGGHIAAGVVDERSIVDVRADDLRGYTQCHFFAGIGGWSLALRLAGWPDDRPVWTGSCPCQPFSAAGKRRGTADERHLWPEFRRLIEECSPTVVFGEQVASRDGRDWLAGVRNDLEALAYAVGAADLCAAGVGAPHIRQRLWWVADAAGEGRRPERQDIDAAHGVEAVRAGEAEPGRCGAARGLGDAASSGRPGLGGRGEARASERSGMGDASGEGFPQRSEPERRGSVGYEGPAADASGPVGFWSDADWLPCTDGKARRTQPGLSPLAHGVPARVGRLRAYGNAIVPQVAAEFVKAFDGRPHDLPPHPTHRDRRP